MGLQQKQTHSIPFKPEFFSGFLFATAQVAYLIFIMFDDQCRYIYSNVYFSLEYTVVFVNFLFARILTKNTCLFRDAGNLTVT